MASSKQPVGNRFDNYVVETMHRSSLRAAPYNPRVLGDKEKKKLQAGLKKHGMLAPPVWNKRTGNLVAGHQRLSILDAFSGNPDYTLQIAVVDLNEAQEKEANLLLNNPQAMGDWDLTKLDEMLKDTNVELVGTGFDMADVYKLLGEAPGRSSEEVSGLADKLRDAQNMYANVQTNSKKRDTTDFYLVLVFEHEDVRTDFLAKLDLDDNRYQDGQGLLAMLLKAEESVKVAAEAIEKRTADERVVEAKKAAKQQGKAGMLGVAAQMRAWAGFEGRSEGEKTMLDSWAAALEAQFAAAPAPLLQD